MPEYSVVLFHSTAHAIRAEKVLEGAGFQIKLIPTPRQISSDCGIALRFGQPEEEPVAATLGENRVPFNGIHRVWARLQAMGVKLGWVAYLATQGPLHCQSAK